MSEKYFTVEEANRLVPDLLEEIPRLQTLFSVLNTKFPDIKKARKQTNLNGGSLEGEAYLKVALEVNRRVKELEEKGCILKGVEQGLVDFLALREGKEIYLCWRAPEKEIRFWHDLDAGFAGRQPI